MNIADHCESSLLIATNPSAPASPTLSQPAPPPNAKTIARTAAKRDPLPLRGRPPRHPRAPHGVPEADHARDGRPAVLAEPAVRARAARARARAAVGRALVRVGVREAVAREDGRGAVRVREREDVREDVGV